jgi:hypothetical protein
MLPVIALVYERFRHIYLRKKLKPKQYANVPEFKIIKPVAAPKILKTDEDIRQYIKENPRNFPDSEDWKPYLEEMVRELVDAGWNTGIPIYTKYKFGSYQIHLFSDDQQLTRKLYDVIHKYEELYDTKDFYSNSPDSYS